MVEQKIKDYDSAVTGINNCLQAMQLHKHLLPTIIQSDFVSVSPEVKALDISPDGIFDSNRMMDDVEALAAGSHG